MPEDVVIVGTESWGRGHWKSRALSQ